MGGGLVIVYVSIGNSDDKLPQAEWSRFVREVDSSVRHHADAVHGFWLSPPDAQWQNACWCVEYQQLDVWPTQVDEQKRWLGRVAQTYRQDSIAWAEAPTTEFLGRSLGDRTHEEISSEKRASDV
jgi:hypothetical protein